MRLNRLPKTGLDARFRFVVNDAFRQAAMNSPLGALQIRQIRICATNQQNVSDP